MHLKVFGLVIGIRLINFILWPVDGHMGSIKNSIASVWIDLTRSTKQSLTHCNRQKLKLRGQDAQMIHRFGARNIIVNVLGHLIGVFSWQ